MPDEHASSFRALHHQRDVLFLPNAWDAASAVMQARAGARAVATSSAALCWALGYRDGGTLPVGELIAAVRRITRVLPVPLTVDIEEGYSNSAQDVADLVVELRRAGAVGINVEDGDGPSQLQAEKIRAIRSRIPPADLFINAITDVYLRSLAAGPQAVSAVVARAGQYADAGADGLFVPGLKDVEQTAQIARRTPLPLNLMALPGLPAVESLQQAGLRRLSAGPAIFLAAYAAAARATDMFLAGRTEPVFAEAQGFGQVDALFPK